MNVDFRYCPQCVLQLRAQNTLSSWETRLNCLTCKMLIQINHGDPQGGSTDSYHFLPLSTTTLADYKNAINKVVKKPWNPTPPTPTGPAGT